MKSPPRIIGLLLLLSGSLALASEPMPLYVKARNTHLKASSKASAQTVTVLQPGDEVTFLGREAGTPWCRVELPSAAERGFKKRIKGVIFQANLSTTPPKTELSGSEGGEAIDAQAFASSGAAVKALGPGVIDYGEQKPELEPHVKSLHALEDLAAEVDEAAVAKTNTSKNLPTVVGAPTRGSK